MKPACKPSNGSTEPGGTRVQAVGSSPEIVIVVIRIIRPSVSGVPEKADGFIGYGRQQSRMR